MPGMNPMMSTSMFCRSEHTPRHATYSRNIGSAAWFLRGVGRYFKPIRIERRARLSSASGTVTVGARLAREEHNAVDLGYRGV
ncbi:hypothetical protein CFII64_06045 [Pseudomonas sp. CFII64]|nr:hypothetical protein CFII64_06045 [Pseudomonas sp. CFII64]